MHEIANAGDFDYPKFCDYFLRYIHAIIALCLYEIPLLLKSNEKPSSI